MAQMTGTEWSIQQVARLAGTTSRALRHYQAESLLEPSRVAANGYRFYDEACLVRLQRILLLRQLGLGIDAIRTVLDDGPSTLPALRRHLELLELQRHRVERQIEAVRHTIDAEEGGGRIMAEKVFDGFDHTQYEDEVVERWGRDAYHTGDTWWRGMSDGERGEWSAHAEQLSADWAAASRRGTAADSEEARTLAERHVEWLGSVPGIPRGGDGRPDPGYVEGLGDMYVTDARFAANYGGEAGARLVRDALRAHLGSPPAG